ncbi:MAG: hypothetical protein WC332_05035 [Clostridia bacterium]|jgi:hypothetical protein
MTAIDKDILTAKLFFNAAFPVMQVLLDDDPKLKKMFKQVNNTVQFGAQNNGRTLACHMKFNNGKVDIVQGTVENPDLSLIFPTVQKMNALLTGGLAMPSIKGGFKNLSLLVKTLFLLMGLMKMSPKNKPKDFEGKALKIKMSLYMITRALSTYNKLGVQEMVEFTSRQPDRIYQFTVENEGKPDYIACYLRIKAGKTKSGHGVYNRRFPFVHFRFLSVDGAIAVLGKEVEFVEGVEKGYVETIGSPEYACMLNDFMAVLQAMLT